MCSICMIFILCAAGVSSTAMARQGWATAGGLEKRTADRAMASLMLADSAEISLSFYINK